MARSKTTLINHVFATVLLWPGSEAVAEEIPVREGLLLPEYTVSARKREESLQAIPDQVTLFSEDQIREARLESINDFFALTPSLHYVNPTNAVEAPLLIRGVGNFGIGEPSVGFFVDGVFLGATTSYFTQALFDIDRIEVLRGPQSALYGKSSTGGAINIITRAPVLEQEYSMRALYGEHDRTGLQAVMNAPLAGNELAGRLALNYEDFDGFFRNSFNGKPVDNNRQQNLRASLLWQPSQRLSVTPTVSVRDQDQHGFAYRRAADARDYGGISLARNDVNNVNVDTQGASLRIEYELPNSLFTSITAINNNDQDFGVDFDYSPAPLFFARQDSNFIDFSQELRLTGHNTVFDSWLAGAYVYLLKDDFEQEILATGPAGTPIAREVNTGHSRTFSVFGQVDYAMTDTLILTLGARLDHDQREQTAPAFSKEADFTSVSPKLSLSWYVNDHVMVYGSTALSHRPGGFNDDDLPAFDEEQSTSAEFGFKSNWKTLRFNGAVFYNHIDDQQIFELDLTTVTLFTSNKGVGETLGLELDAGWQVSKKVLFNAAFNYTSAQFKEFSAVLPGPGGIGLFDFSGNELQFVPEYEAVLSAQYSDSIGEILHEPVSLTGRVDARFGGPKAWDDFNSAFSKDIQIVNAGLAFHGNKWRLTLFVNNVLDEEYFTNFIAGFRFPFAGGDALGARGAPRHWGMSVQLDY